MFLSLAPVASAKFREINSTGFEGEIPVVKTEELTAQETPLPTFETVNAVKDNNQKLYGVVGKSQVINFDRSISRVSITDNSIADVVVISTKQLMINGKKPGMTSVIFWSEDSSAPVFYNLVIQQNADAFIQAVEFVAPNENIALVFNDDGAVLTGHLSSTAVKEKITALAKAYNMKLTDMVTPDDQPLCAGEYLVKIRSAAKLTPCLYDGQGEVSFPEPVRAPAPGQSAVFYRDGLVYGGGIIDETD